jgi:Na+-transporting methylmalonyl-CoA/oxaloacetate decarboxylase gamma subunit
VTQDLLLALQITVIGMGLVFGSIILFELVMVALVRITKPSIEQPPEGELRERGLSENVSPESDLRKRRAAVAAVAVALARRGGTAQPPARPASPFSAWQVVQRAKSLRIFPQGRGPLR